MYVTKPIMHGLYNYYTFFAIKKTQLYTFVGTCNTLVLVKVEHHFF